MNLRVVEVSFPDVLLEFHENSLSPHLSPHLLQRKKRHKQGIEAGNEAEQKVRPRVIHLIVFKTMKDRK